jgi:hypothetical protein
VGVTKEDVFDADIELTAGSNTTSLAGGLLLLTKLSQVGYVDGAPHEGQVMAYAGGPIVAGSADKPENIKVGRVLGGARVKKDQPYVLMLRENRRSIRTSALLQSVIGTRFFYLDGVEQKAMAEAKSDEFLELRVPKTYHQNQSRFFQVLQLLPIIENPDLKAARMAQWSKELLDPKTSGVAALKLEGAGRAATESLKQGLANSDPNVKFFSAEALAYLNDASGADILADAAVRRPEFRAFALAALAAADQAASVSKLRQLLAHPDIEVRYGAFNALRSLDENDIYLGKTRVLIDEPIALPDDEDDLMAMQIVAARARANRPKDPFSLYLVDCDGPPLVHVSNSRRSEIVVFGKRQKLTPPLVLGDPGSVLINAGSNDDEAQISRVAADKDSTDQHLSSPLDLGSIIQNSVALGATYPQVVGLLRMAEKQKNLEGPLCIDAMPQATDAYEKAQLASQAKPAKKDEAVQRAGGVKDKGRRPLLDRLRPKPRNGTKENKKSG